MKILEHLSPLKKLIYKPEFYLSLHSSKTIRDTRKADTSQYNILIVTDFSLAYSGT